MLGYGRHKNMGGRNAPKKCKKDNEIILIIIMLLHAVSYCLVWGYCLY